jgi:hydroxymethylglutaryl-CoA synthase
MGIPPGSAAFVRGNEEVLALEGKKCAQCGTIAVPPTVHPVCPSCGSAEGTTVALARTGTVHTFVVNHTMPAPFEAPLPLVVADLDDGARVLLQGMPEDAAALDIGDRVVLELRRYAVERGAPVYGYKVRRVAPVNGSANGSAPAAEPATAGAERGES